MCTWNGYSYGLLSCVATCWSVKHTGKWPIMLYAGVCVFTWWSIAENLRVNSFCYLPVYWEVMWCSRLPSSVDTSQFQFCMALFKLLANAQSHITFLAPDLKNTVCLSVSSLFFYSFLFSSLILSDSSPRSWYGKPFSARFSCEGSQESLCMHILFSHAVNRMTLLELVCLKCPLPCLVSYQITVLVVRHSLCDITV